MSDFKLDWRGNDALLVLEGATREGLLTLGYQLEGEIKVGAPVDTGFMRNTVYVHSSEVSTFQAQSRDGYETTSAPPAVDDDTVIVGVAADYAIYVESTQPFVYPALQRVAQVAGATVASAIRDKLA